MATTANYGWTTPDDTDLVKDGASAIRTLGSAIDTTVKANADATGLVHINTTSFSAVASQSVNNVFSADYDNYLLLIDLTYTLTGTINLRFRASGTDATTGYNNINAYGTNAWTFGTRINNNTGTSIVIGSDVGGSTLSTETKIFNPFLSERTYLSNAGYVIAGAYDLSGGDLNNTNSYDGFTIFKSGTITGTVSVYGYKD